MYWDKYRKMNVLVVGGGPGGLAAAIRAKQRFNESKSDASVVLIEKAEDIGKHNLSGAVFKADCLDELLPKWRHLAEEDLSKYYEAGNKGRLSFPAEMLDNKVKKEALYFLLNDKTRTRIPIPLEMHHKNDYTISVSKLSKWLAAIAEDIGVEIYTNFAAENVIVEDACVKGIKLIDKGRDEQGNPFSTFIPGEELRADIVVLADGARGPLSEKLINHPEFMLRKGKNHQMYSIGVKKVFEVTEDNEFGNNRVVHMMGYPLPFDVFGGGFMYKIGNRIHAGIVIGADAKHYDLDPQLELEMLLQHKWVKKMINGGRVIASGSRIIPEGGYYSFPELTVNGAILVGDSVGFVDMRKIMGLHYAIRSGMSAGDSVLNAITNNNLSGTALKDSYTSGLELRGVMKDMRKARNYRQIFQKPFGQLLYPVHRVLPRIRTKPDHIHITDCNLDRKIPAGITDKATLALLSGTFHSENQPCHVTIKHHEKCRECIGTYNENNGESVKNIISPCISSCPAEVYSWDETEQKIVRSPGNCQHCQLCAIRCSKENLIWNVPEMGGPKHKEM